MHVNSALNRAKVLPAFEARVVKYVHTKTEMLTLLSGKLRCIDVDNQQGKCFERPPAISILFIPIEQSWARDFIMYKNGNM